MNALTASEDPAMLVLDWCLLRGSARPVCEQSYLSCAGEQ